MAKETTQQTRQQIIELKESGLPISQVAKALFKNNLSVR